MGLIIRKPGVLTTIQDLGRTGARHLGINPNGVMDVAAARLVNIVLGNHDESPVLEFHFPAPAIEFDSDTTIAIGGAHFDARLDDIELQNWSSSSAKKGSVLQFLKPRFGVRGYLAVEGGICVKPWLGSSSTNLTAAAGGFSGRRLMAGDRIECVSISGNRSGLRIGLSIIPAYSDRPTIRFIAGNEFDFLTATSEAALFREEFVLTRDCNRMGYRLAGTPLYLLHDLQMVSAGATFGTVQLLPDGQLVILMADHQTSGGYPRIGNIISRDLPLLAQCGPGDRLTFVRVTVEEAERVALHYEKELNFLRLGYKFRS